MVPGRKALFPGLCPGCVRPLATDACRDVKVTGEFDWETRRGIGATFVKYKTLTYRVPHCRDCASKLMCRTILVQSAFWVPIALVFFVGFWYGLGTFLLMLIALSLALFWFFVIQKFSLSYVSLFTTGQDNVFTFSSQTYAQKLREINPSALSPPQPSR